MLTLAVLGLCIGSLVTLAYATQDDVAGEPDFYVQRQGIFFAIGALVAVVVSRVDYSRLREWRIPIYGLLITGIVATQLLGSDTRGSRRAIELPFFEVQFSELGKLLLVVALAGFAVERIRALHHHSTTARIMVLTLVPAGMVIAQDL